MARGAVRLVLPGLRPPSSSGAAASWNAPNLTAAALGPHEKLLHFVRHAEGTHNLNRLTIKEPVAHDAKLTATGVRQCAQLQRASADLRPELVVTSPLTRTCQTAELCFGPQIAAAGAKLVALESVRETVNYMCDGRRPLSQIAAEHPAVDFSCCPHDRDEIWARYVAKYGDHEAHRHLRETADLGALASRALDAVEWLGARPEKEIVVVGHSAFWGHFFRFGHGGDDVGRCPKAVEYGVDGAGQALAAWMMAPFANCEMRTVVGRWAAAG